MTIRAIIFDIGGVLNSVQPTRSVRAWESHLGLAEGQLLPLVFDNQMSQRSSLGQATRQEIWDFVNRQLRLPPADFSKLQADVWGCYWWDMDLLTFIRSLRPRCKTAILSNAWVDARLEMQDHINDDTFDVIVYSSEEGLLKADPEIYRRTLQRLTVAPAEAIFVDDMPRNVRAAEALGIHGILFTGSLAVQEQIRRLLKSP